MLDAPFAFFSLLIAVVALAIARNALNRADGLRARLDALVAASEATAAGAAVPPPLPQFEQTTGPSPWIAAEHPAMQAERQPVVTEETSGATPIAPGTTTATPPPLPPQ